jgi:HAE1 family hydrophobic/amphiphilic exporter-1
MNLYDIAIRRPVFTFMLMLALVVFGILGYQALPINLLPSIEFPMVTVITILPGASPEVMESDVTDVIEAAVNTIEGIDQLTSYSGQGVSQVTVMFTTERDVDIAAQDVRDKVSGAVGQLPLDAEPPIVQKFDVNSQPMLWMALAGLDARELSDYADQVVKPALQSVPGIGNVIVPGFREPMIRICHHGAEPREPRAAGRIYRRSPDRTRGSQPRPLRNSQGLRQYDRRHRRRSSNSAFGCRLHPARRR